MNEKIIIGEIIDVVDLRYSQYLIIKYGEKENVVVEQLSLKTAIFGILKIALRDEESKSKLKNKIGDKIEINSSLLKLIITQDNFEDYIVDQEKEFNEYILDYDRQYEEYEQKMIDKFVNKYF